jgi:hypothetical protein
VVHGVALVAVHPLVLVHLVDDEQIQPAAGSLLDVAGQRYLAIAEVVVGIKRREVNRPAGGDGFASGPFSRGVQLKAASLLRLAAPARELEQGGVAAFVAAEAGGRFELAHGQGAAVDELRLAAYRAAHAPLLQDADLLLGKGAVFGGQVQQLPGRKHRAPGSLMSTYPLLP